jgi:phage-related baseplate assembly protein
MATAELPLFGFDPSIVPDIDFCQKDSSVIESDVITNYEKFFTAVTRINKTLGRADPVRLFLLTNIYQLVTQRSIVDSTGKQNLLKYSKGANLDNVAAKWGVRGGRLKPTSAETLLRFTVSAVQPNNEVVIKLGQVAQTAGGIRFKTIEEGIIPAGLLFVDCEAEAETPGSEANGLVPGQINYLVEWNEPYLVSVTNLTTSSGGANKEGDEHLRARTWFAPESFSVAGPYGAYEWFAGSANPDIADVSVWSNAENAGKVFIYPLMANGELPTQEVLDQVYKTCSADDVRPLTDWVFVELPTVVSYSPMVQYWIKSSDEHFADDIRKKVDAAYMNYLIWQRSKIGRDINPSKCDEMIVNAGAKRTDIPEGTSGFKFVKIDEQSVAREDASSKCTYVGIEIE